MDGQKQCRGCLSVLSLESFYRHSRMPDGRLNYCCDCVKARVRKHRENNLERIRAYDKARSTRPERKQSLRNLAKRHQADPVRRAATTATSNAIRDGRLIRPDTCSACGNRCRPDAHHDDYARPLDVRWLCRPCHSRHHRLASLGVPF